MKRLAMLTAAICLGLVSIAVIGAQEREDRTFLSWDEMRAIINEVSGERAMHHVLELVPYPRVRPRAEYEGHFRESQVMAQLARDYGYSSVEVESFPTPQRLWQASQGELWMIEPEVRKLYDIHDIAISLAPNSEPGEVTAEVVDVGAGARSEDYAGKQLQGKIVLGSASTTVLQRMGVFERNAAGILSYNSLRADSYPDQILSQSITNAAAGPPAGAGGNTESRKTGFGWAIAPRVARELSAIISRGQKVVLRSIVKAETFPGELEIVHATIQGDGSSNQDIVVSAHLYEGYIKQGANDDNSGCAMTLEMGRAYIRLVKEGKLPKPKRTIHFLWVPEISGTNAWLNKHTDIKSRVIADLNFDMEGLRLSTSGSFWVMHRTPDTFPTFLNDLGTSVLEFVANLNRERVRYRANGYRFTLPVTAPNGSQDPFYYVIDKHYGASDHVTYMQHGIPALMFVTWPDMWYHSSQDTPDKLDSTQFKRAAVVGTGAMSALASAGDETGMKAAGESLARGAARMGDSQRKGLGYLADAPDAASLVTAYKEARNAVRHQAEIEQAVVLTAGVLFANKADAEKKLASFVPLIDQRAAALQKEITAFYRIRAEQVKAAPVEPEMTAEEKQAARMIVERVPRPGGAGGFGGGGGGGGGRGAATGRIPQHMTAELNLLLGKKKSALAIRDFLSGEFEPLPLAYLLEYLKAQEQSGAVKMTTQP